MMAMLGPHALALAATLAIELPIVAALSPAGLRRIALLTALFANLTSHSLESIGLWVAQAAQSGEAWFAAELAVLAFEAAAFALVARIPWRRSIVLSLAANLPSALAGVLLETLVWR